MALTTPLLLNHVDELKIRKLIENNVCVNNLLAETPPVTLPLHLPFYIIVDIGITYLTSHFTGKIF